jgi:hypothetical protein
LGTTETSVPDVREIASDNEKEMTREEREFEVEVMKFKMLMNGHKYLFVCPIRDPNGR